MFGVPIDSRDIRVAVRQRPQIQGENIFGEVLRRDIGMKCDGFKPRPETTSSRRLGRIVRGLYPSQLFEENRQLVHEKARLLGPNLRALVRRLVPDVDE